MFRPLAGGFELRISDLPQMKNSNGISTTKVILSRFEEDKAILVVDSEEIILSKKCLPKVAKEGEALVLTLATEAADTKRREQTAKDILNEILKSK